MAVSEQERDYMRRLGEHEAEVHAKRLAEHLALDLEERLQRSFMLAWRFRKAVRQHAREDDPGAIYERARALGLYRP